MNKYPTDSFERGLSQLNVVLSDKQIQQFMDYYELLVEWNKVMNLTAITDFEDVISKHFLDSLSSVRVCDYHEKLKIIDVGTGAGFPGIPLKIAFPCLNITLLDSLNKRIRFLDTVIDSLGLEDIEAVHGRAEDFARQKEYRESFDLCISRAVANLSTLSEYCLPYVKKGGVFVSYKSGKIEEEVEMAGKAVRILGGRIREVEKFQLADTDMDRSLVVIEKEKNTPKTYPRKAGLPSKEPLS